MKLIIFSDCHLEFHRDDGASFVHELVPVQNAVAVVAGDLSTSDLLEKSFAMLCHKFEHVVFVSGNHELYGTSPSTLGECKSALSSKFANLHWLDNEVVKIGGVRFVGTTLWFPPPPSGTPKWALNDFVQIRGFEPWVYEEHEKALKFLERELGPEDVLMTHHFPFHRSIPRMWRTSSLNPFFHAGERAEAVVSGKKPRLVVHGHTHTSFNYVHEGMAVVCNPHGYPGENHEFDFGKIVEL